MLPARFVRVLREGSYSDGSAKKSLELSCKHAGMDNGFYQFVVGNNGYNSCLFKVYLQA